jgi:hypothetical protein
MPRKSRKSITNFIVNFVDESKGDRGGKEVEDGGLVAD